MRLFTHNHGKREQYYSTHNRYTNFDTFGGAVIETRTWEGYIHETTTPRFGICGLLISGYTIPSNGTYSFRTASDDGVRFVVSQIVINNWTNHAP